MHKTEKTILVMGATGQQGGATARHLLAQGWRVRALVRDHQKPAAVALRQTGVEIVQGDFEDDASLEAAMQGIYGVFSVQPHSDDETHQGKRVADVALIAGVQHFVYTSVGCADELFQLGINIGKWEIEQHIQKIGLPATMLRPAGFMDSLISPSYGVSGDTLAIPIKPDVAYQLIAVDDIGAFTALAFASPEDYLGQTLTLIGDAPTPPQIAASISHATGQAISYHQIPIETLRQQNPEVARACEFINGGGFKGDISRLRKLHPGLLDFDSWLEKEGAAKFAALRKG
jgi:uncharacterized protein YbjT (DUF2867 family)